MSTLRACVAASTLSTKAESCARRGLDRPGGLDRVARRRAAVVQRVDAVAGVRQQRRERLPRVGHVAERAVHQHHRIRVCRGRAAREVVRAHRRLPVVRQRVGDAVAERVVHRIRARSAGRARAERESYRGEADDRRGAQAGETQHVGHSLRRVQSWRTVARPARPLADLHSRCRSMFVIHSPHSFAPGHGSRSVRSPEWGSCCTTHAPGGCGPSSRSPPVTSASTCAARPSSRRLTSATCAARSSSTCCGAGSSSPATRSRSCATSPTSTTRSSSTPPPPASRRSRSPSASPGSSTGRTRRSASCPRRSSRGRPATCPR